MFELISKTNSFKAIPTERMFIPMKPLNKREADDIFSIFFNYFL